MRFLTNDECTSVSAADGENAIMAAMGASLVTIGILALASAAPLKIGYRPVTRYVDEIVPVYDAYGFYMGDVINTYEVTTYEEYYYY